MHQNTERQQDDKQATSTRKHFRSPRAQTRPSVTTEYQERFLPPHCHTASVWSPAPRDPSSVWSPAQRDPSSVWSPAQRDPSSVWSPAQRDPSSVWSPAQRDPSRPLKGTSAAMTTLRSISLTNKLTKRPPKAPQPSESPKYHRRCSITNNPMRFEVDQMESKVRDYTSVYKNDFQAWKVKKRLPYKLTDSLTVNQGLVVTDRPSQGVPQVRKPQPFESVTSYRSDYITHPVQPIRRVKPAQPTKGLLSEPAVSLKPRVAWDVNQDICDEASAFFQAFKSWSRENKFRGKARESGPPADGPGVLTTTRADDTEHKCQCATPACRLSRRSTLSPKVHGLQMKMLK